MDDEEYFTKQEAKAKVGLPVRKYRSYSPVPRYIAGTIIGIRKIEKNSYVAVVQWNLPRRKASDELIQSGLELNDFDFFAFTQKHLHIDWFTKSEFETYLEVVSKK